MLVAESDPAADGKQRDLHRLVVVAFLYRDRGEHREFLIMRRPPDAAFYPGKWVGPGGGVETSDFAQEETGVVERAIVREMSEEIGPVAFAAPEFLGSRGFLRSDGTSIVVLSFLARWLAGVPTPTPEAVEFAWVTAEEAASYDLVGTTLEELQTAAALHEQEREGRRVA